MFNAFNLCKAYFLDPLALHSEEEISNSAAVDVIVERNILSDVIQKVPERIIEYCKKNMTLLPEDVRLMNVQIANYAIQTLKDTSRSTAYSIALMLVNKFPQLADRVKDQPIGKGHESLGMRIYNAINCRKDANDKKRKAGPHPLFDTMEEIDNTASRRQDQYGCVEYQPKILETDFEKLEEKRLQLFDLYNSPNQWDFKEITIVLNDLFHSLRFMINAENRCVLKVILHCPFLGESKFLLEHASRVIYGKEGRSGKTLNDIWHENIMTTVPAMKEYCNSLYFLAEQKKKKSKNDPILKKIYSMIVEAEIMCKKTEDQIPIAICFFQILIAYLNEKEELLIKVIEVS